MLENFQRRFCNSISFSEIDIGFTPSITWLTAIHFHYSFFLLNLFVGLFGRVRQGKWYTSIAVVMIAGWIFVNIGITLSSIIEMVSFLLYSGDL